MATTNAPIKTFLWFDTEADEAAKFYIDTFGGEVTSTHRYSSHSDRSGEVMIVGFKIRGQEFMGLNGGPHHKPTPAVSFSIACDTQEEIDRYWDKILAHGGKEAPCGWIADKWGFNWQIVPTDMGEIMGDAATAPRVSAAMSKMKRINIQQLRDAKEGN